MNKIQIYIHGENNREPKLVDIADTALVEEISKICRIEFPTETGDGKQMLFLEDTEDALKAKDRLADAGINGRMHVHCHRCQKITVTVFYNGEDKAFKFSPATVTKVILRKATAAFGIKDTDAGDYLLKLEDKVVLRPGDHIGSYAKFPHCQVKLFLTATKPIQG